MITNDRLIPKPNGSYNEINQFPANQTYPYLYVQYSIVCVQYKYDLATMIL